MATEQIEIKYEGMGAYVAYVDGVRIGRADSRIQAEMLAKAYINRKKG